MNGEAPRIDRPRSAVTRAILRAFREVRRSSTAGLHWRRQGEFITFRWHGFVRAPDVPMLFARHDREVALIRRVLAGRSFSRCLEFGCGFGRLSPTLAGLAESHVGVDINADALRAAQSAYPELSFALVDGERLPFDERSFDLVVCWTVLQHVPPARVANVLAEIRRVASRDGLLLLCESTRYAGQPSRHCWERSVGFYEDAFDEWRLADCETIAALESLPGMTAPTVMLFEPR